MVYVYASKGLKLLGAQGHEACDLRRLNLFTYSSPEAADRALRAAGLEYTGTDQGRRVWATGKFAFKAARWAHYGN